MVPHLELVSLRICEQGTGRKRGPKSTRNGNMKECECPNFSSRISGHLHYSCILDAYHSYGSYVLLPLHSAHVTDLVIDPKAQI
jgi:hypothetical protein